MDRLRVVGLAGPRADQHAGREAEAEAARLAARARRLVAEIDTAVGAPNPLRCARCDRYRPRHDTTCSHCGWVHGTRVHGDPGDTLHTRTAGRPDWFSGGIELRAARIVGIK